MTTSTSEDGGPGPKEILVRAYQVGFGDCFLLSFRYEAPGTDRHVLIDFGSTEIPDGAPKRPEMLRRIAHDIEKKCGGHLHAVVATHRHADHINGFSTQDDEEGSGDVIRLCKPDLVLQPWTEQPEAPSDPRVKPFLDRLNLLHAVASRVETRELRRLHGIKGYSSDVLKELGLFAANNAGTHEVANRRAVENLRKMGKESSYLSYGQEAKLDLPGVKVHVLGPPTLAAWPQIERQRASDPDEFWQLLVSSSPLADSLGPLFDVPATPVSEWAPQQARWLIRRLSSLRGEQLLEMVRVLDDVLNNTSLILLFKAGDQKLLFPGDAQLENWSYALGQAGIGDLLKDATLYKVGHHGSRNATPKSLWKMIGNAKLQSIVSTKPGKHGDADRKTEVPRATLIEALKHYELHSTQEMGWNLSPQGEPPFLTVSLEPRYGTEAAPTSEEPQSGTPVPPDSSPRRPATGRSRRASPPDR